MSTSVSADTRDRQFRASNPHGSAWVSANAGSGKTYVLAQRVIRLLLEGVEPGRILCLTFTKAAAAEMADRVFRILGQWATLGDDDLKAKIDAYLGEGTVTGDQTLGRARRLFALALETPGGLKIQTIHAFCERLLHQFPFEAEIAGNFVVMDDQKAAELLAEAETVVLSAAADGTEPALAAAYETLLDAASDSSVRDALRAVIGRRDAFQRWQDHAGGLDAALADLAKTLGCEKTDRAAIEHETPFAGGFDRAYATTLLADLDAGGKPDQLLAGRLRDALEAAPGPDGFRAWLDVFTTTGGKARKSRSVRRFVTKAIREAWPDIDERVTDEQVRLEAIWDRYCAALAYEASAALFRVGSATLRDYSWRKAALGVLDYDDLIVRTADLLSRSEAAQWVQYKLDYGIEHILVDEAQDTSPRQWEVVLRLSDEFFAGASAAQRLRTVFSVGDEKQSIYSFQGAVPHWFTDMRRYFASRAQGANAVFDDVRLNLSFRSSPDVLSAVDAVFASPEISMGIAPEDLSDHIANRHRDPGLVEIWPELVAESVEPDEDWLKPIDAVGATSPPVRLADRIADTIDRWLKDGTCLEGTGKPIRPGDILILVRKRGPFVRAMARALKQKEIPVAGTDRLALTDDIAALDLLAMGDFLLLPEDDLTLAAVLKSPLIGLDEDQLFDLAHRRDGPLWQALERRAGEASPFGRAYARLSDWRGRADLTGPFEFYTRLLSGDGIRRRFRTVFGGDVDEILDEFVARTLAYEQSVRAPSLQDFVAWMRLGQSDIKREVDQTRDEARIMTVHGAKGLEAGIVFLVDSGKPIHAGHRPDLLRLGEGEGAPIIWRQPARQAAAIQTAAVEEADARAKEEYYRLLYVAMTRACDRLYICGLGGKRGLDEASWHRRCVEALVPGATEIEDDDGETLCWRWRTSGMPPHPAETDATGGPVAASLPAWIDAPVPAPRERGRRVRPSRVLEDLGLMPEAAHAAGEEAASISADDAAARGVLIHRLLELLPRLDPDGRRAAALRYLASAAAERPEADREQLADEALAVLADPALAGLFDEPAEPEVEIAGTFRTRNGHEHAVSGQIDRLVVRPDELLVLDFKSGRTIPETPAAIPEPYVAQLALYRLLLADIHPGRRVRCALLWTGGPDLMDVPEAQLDAMAARILSQGA